MYSNIKIGNFKINPTKTFIVAEMSANHNNSLERALKIIKAAKRCGANAIKLQTYQPDTITLNCSKKDFLLRSLEKNSPWKKYKTYYEIFKKGATPLLWHKRLFMAAKKIGLTIFSTPFNEGAVDFLEKLDCCAYKIASPEINHIPLLIKVSKTKKPIILSTGLAEEKDIELAIRTIKRFGNNKIILLKCSTAYPAPLKDANLRNINYLEKKYKVKVGYSDHTVNNLSALAAISLGACLIEKHINLNDRTKTLDSFFSLNENNFKKLVSEIRLIEEAMGKKNYFLAKSSRKNFFSRRSIYISKNIKKGEKINKNNIKVVRPSFGLEPKYYNYVLKKKAKKNLFFGDRLRINDLI
jgi:pseudaminic acid synthase